MEIRIRDEFIKLGQALKLADLVSDGVEAKYVINDGLVKVNGEVDTRRGRKVYGGDVISYNGQDGYVKSQYLAIAGQESEGESSQSGTRKSATTNVKIRSSASATSEQLGMVIGGDSVEVLSESGEWSQIRYNGITGYVKSEYLQ